jgi:hypothetical protein
VASLIVIGIILLNLFISWWNCKSSGAVWHEAKKVGGFMRVLVWCGAIQAAIGFSSVIMLFLAFGAYATGNLSQQYAEAAFSLWYLLIIIPAIGTGLIITIHSLITAWRERSIANMGVAAWNTFATGMNLYNAASDIPNAFDKVGDLFKGDKDDQKVALVFLIVIVALAGGAFITAMLIRHYAKQYRPQPVYA